MPSGRYQSGRFVGTWRLRGDVIEFHLVEQGARPTTLTDRWKIVSLTDESLSVTQLTNESPLDLIVCPQ